MNRKTICILFTITFIITLCGCKGSSSNTLSSAVTDSSTPASQSAAETTEDLSKYAVKGFVYNGFDKYSSLENFKVTDTTYNVFTAKNECESVQISFVAEKDFERVGFSIEGSTPGITVTQYLEYLVPCGNENYPDPLVEYDGDAVSVSKNELLTFFIDFKTDKTAESGESVYKFYLCDVNGRLSNTVTVKLNVWDFAFPDGYSCRSYVEINEKLVKKYTDSYTEETYRQYYDTLLEHGLSAKFLPYDIMDPRADAYMSDPRVTSFQVPSASETPDEKIILYCNKLKSNPEWLKKAYFYPLDEPTTIERLNRLLELCTRLINLCPEIKIVCPYYTNIDVSEHSDQTEFMSRFVNILCPKPCMWNDDEFYTAEQKQKYASFETRMKQYVADGNELWWYVCNTPGKPYLNLFVDEEGLDHRVLFWQQYRHGVTGFLYWSANGWGATDDPWNDVDTKSLSYPTYGDGILLYPGSKVNVNGPVVSLRLKSVRDGIEDYELFVLAEEVLGRDYIMNKLISVSPDVTKVSVDSTAFCNIRNEIGNAIEKQINK